jgi:hypothetical protein
VLEESSTNNVGIDPNLDKIQPRTELP